MKYHALFVILKKRQNLKLSSAANYRWRFKGLNHFPAEPTDKTFPIFKVQHYLNLSSIVDQDYQHNVPA